MIIQDCERHGDELPDQIKNAPILEDWMLFYFDAFHELGTDRQFGFQAGPIPMSSLFLYVDRYDFSEDDAEDFFFIIRQMDNHFLKEQERKAKSKAKAKK